MFKRSIGTAVTLCVAAIAWVVPVAIAEAAPPDRERATQLVDAIRQRASADRRATAWEKAKSLLHGSEQDQFDALLAIAHTADIRIDRAGLEPTIASLLSSDSALVRRAALDALPAVKPDEKCLDAIGALASDADAKVRAGVMASFAAVRASSRIDTPVTEPALTLLADAEKEVVVETARSLWGVPVSADVEAKAIELCRFSDDDVPSTDSIAYWMHYFVLSTRPQISGPVAKRLAEIASHPKLDPNWTGRAVWGLTHASSPEAADTVATALIAELDHSTLDYNRRLAVQGLASLRTDAALKKLAEVAKSDESEAIRQMAAAALAK